MGRGEPLGPPAHMTMGNLKCHQTSFLRPTYESYFYLIKNTNIVKKKKLIIHPDDIFEIDISKIFLDEDGQAVLVEGPLKQERWEEGDNKRHTYKIPSADKIVLLGGAKQEEERQPKQVDVEQQFQTEEVPF